MAWTNRWASATTDAELMVDFDHIFDKLTKIIIIKHRSFIIQRLLIIVKQIKDFIMTTATPSASVSPSFKSVADWFSHFFKSTKWWREVVTDKTRSWGLFSFICMALLSGAYSVYLFHIKAAWMPIIINSAFCLTLSIIAIITMYQIYRDKIALEDQAWMMLSQNITEARDPKMQKFYEAYQETRWLAHTPPVALMIHLSIVSASSVYIWLNLSFDRSLDYIVAYTLAVLAIIITVKLINDIYNLLNNFKKSKGLVELFDKNKTI